MYQKGLFAMSIKHDLLQQDINEYHNISHEVQYTLKGCMVHCEAIIENKEMSNIIFIFTQKPLQKCL